MKIIEIKQTKYGEVAYIFDEQQGRVIKVMVDDYTMRKERERDYEIKEEPEDDPRYTRPTRRGFVEDSEDNRGGEKLPPDDEPEKKSQPLVKKRTIMPPYMRGMFIKPGSPGASEERREVG